jgi:hypothetical protein
MLSSMHRNAWTMSAVPVASGFRRRAKLKSSFLDA